MPPEEFTGLLVRFAAELRAAGLAVGSGDVLLYCSALSTLDPTDLVDLYWAGRTTLVNRHDDLARYDEVFRRFFLGAEGPAEDLLLMLRASAQAQGALAIPATEPGEAGQEDDAVLGWMASDVEALKHKSFAACTPEELAALRRIMARIRLTPPRRRTRRTVPSVSVPTTVPFSAAAHTTGPALPQSSWLLRGPSCSHCTTSCPSRAAAPQPRACSNSMRSKSARHTWKACGGLSPSARQNAKVL